MAEKDHKKFNLKGGPHDGMQVRLYPDQRRGDDGKKLPMVWLDLNFSDSIYEHPSYDDQDLKKPYLLWKSK